MLDPFRKPPISWGKLEVVHQYGSIATWSHGHWAMGVGRESIPHPSDAMLIPEAPRSNLPEIEKKKFLVPGTMPLGSNSSATISGCCEFWWWHVTRAVTMMKHAPKALIELVLKILKFELVYSSVFKKISAHGHHTMSASRLSRGLALRHCGEFKYIIHKHIQQAANGTGLAADQAACVSWFCLNCVDWTGWCSRKTLQDNYW